jgi:hypothetical protein
MAGGCHPSTLGDSDVYRIACGVAFLLIVCSSVRAQDPAIDDLKGKIFDARMAQQTLGDGLKYCPELNGKSFYFRVRNRILESLPELEKRLQELQKNSAASGHKD